MKDILDEFSKQDAAPKGLPPHHDSLTPDFVKGQGFWSILKGYIDDPKARLLDLEDRIRGALSSHPSDEVVRFAGQLHDLVYEDREVNKVKLEEACSYYCECQWGNLAK